MKDQSKTLIFFIILIIYVLFQFSWWLYLLIDSQSEIVASLIKINPENKVILQTELHRKHLMILGEGFVFLILLLIGGGYTIRVFRKEVELGNQQRNFLLSITHELKSPLSSIKLYLQTLQKRELSESKKQEIFENSISDTNRLTNLVDNILIATRIENNSYPINFENTELSTLIRSLFETWHSKKKKRMVFELTESFAKVDKLLYGSVVMNLVENALKYSSNDVIIQLSKDAILKVIDTGQGISKKNKNKIFNRFYREGNEQTRTTKGTGLGLYLVKQIAKLHHGKAIVEVNKPSGSIFTFSLNNN